MKKNSFIKAKKSKVEEITMLFLDDKNYRRSFSYIKILLSDIFSEYKQINKKTQVKILRDLSKDIIFAANKYLGEYLKTKKIKYPFSTYFTWYIAKRINKYL